MSRGSKDYNKVTHDLVKGSGKSSKEKKKALHKMVEALIAEKTDEAQTHLHTYLKLKTREILVGESDDADDEEIKKGEEKEETKKEKSNEESDDEKEESKEANDEEEKEIEDDDKEDVKEEFAPFGHGEGAMSRKVQGKLQFASKSKKKTMLSHNNHAPGLDKDDVGDLKFTGSGKKSGALKHGNNAPGLEDHPKGNVFTNKK